MSRSGNTPSGSLISGDTSSGTPVCLGVMPETKRAPDYRLGWGSKQRFFFSHFRSPASWALTALHMSQPWLFLNKERYPRSCAWLFQACGDPGCPVHCRTMGLPTRCQRYPTVYLRCFSVFGQCVPPPASPKQHTPLLSVTQESSQESYGLSGKCRFLK